MKKELIFWQAATAILGMLFVASVFTNGFNFDEPDDTTDVNTDETSLAECLSEKGAVMYGTEWCGYCQRQKAMFGDDFEQINFVDCDSEQEKCTEAGVRGFPTWEIGGELYPGLQELNKLKDLAGC